MQVCVSCLSRAVLDSEVGETRTQDLLISDHYAIEPHSHVDRVRDVDSGMTVTYLTISSGKQPLMVLMYSASALPGSALISCTFFSPPLVTNRRLALAS